MAFIYGIFYRMSSLFAKRLTFLDITMTVFLTTMPGIFSKIYHEDVGIGGLHYIALGIGLTIASQINGRTMDRIYIHFKNKNGGVGEPEFRLRKCRPRNVASPFNLILFSIHVSRHVHVAIRPAPCRLGSAAEVTLDRHRHCKSNKRHCHQLCLTAVYFIRVSALWALP